MIVFFFFNDTATTEIYTLSLHDALPILYRRTMIEDISIDGDFFDPDFFVYREDADVAWRAQLDRKSTRLNSSHANISYAVFCLKKKKKMLIPSDVLARYCS